MRRSSLRAANFGQRTPLSDSGAVCLFQAVPIVPAVLADQPIGRSLSLRECLRSMRFPNGYARFHKNSGDNRRAHGSFPLDRRAGRLLRKVDKIFCRSFGFLSQRLVGGIRRDVLIMMIPLATASR